MESSRGALTTAQANLENPKIRDAQVAATERQIAVQQSTIASTKAETAQAQAQLAQAEADRADLTVLAPFSGTWCSPARPNPAKWCKRARQS